MTLAATTSTQNGWADDGDDTNGPRQVFSTPGFSAVDRNTWAFAGGWAGGTLVVCVANGSVEAAILATRLASVTSRLQVVTTLEVAAGLAGLLRWRRVQYEIHFIGVPYCRDGVSEVQAVAWLFDGVGHQRIAFQRSYRFTVDHLSPDELLGGSTPIPNGGTFHEQVGGVLWLRAGRRYRVQAELASLPVAERVAYMKSIIILAFH